MYLSFHLLDLEFREIGIFVLTFPYTVKDPNISETSNKFEFPISFSTAVDKNALVRSNTSIYEACSCACQEVFQLFVEWRGIVRFDDRAVHLLN